VLNIDLAPTFLNIAGVASAVEMDGVSFLPLLNATASVTDTSHATPSRSDWGRQFLLEHSGESETHIPGCAHLNNQQVGVRTYLTVL
jgi:arylsulfatase A-like enzyme